MKEKQVTTTHQLIVDLLKENGITDIHKGVQLFANQYDEEYSISVNYMSTGVHVSKKLVDENELIEDELIRICKTWTYNF